jgi:hypothetical protein
VVLLHSTGQDSCRQPVTLIVAEHLSADIHIEDKEKLIWLMDWVKFAFMTDLEFESLNEKGYVYLNC